MTKKLTQGALAALLTASGRNARVTGSEAEKRELTEAGLATPGGNLTDRGRRTRRSVFEEMEDEAFG